MKLVDQREVQWGSRAQFFALAAQAMRRILVDHARRRQYQKCGGDATDMFERTGMKGRVAWMASHEALTAATFGDCQTAKQKATQALTSVNDTSYSESAIALALCGAVGQAQAHPAKLAPLYPNDTHFSGIWLPVTRAAIELQRGQPAQALQ